MIIGCWEQLTANEIEKRRLSKCLIFAMLNCQKQNISKILYKINKILILFVVSFNDFSFSLIHLGVFNIIFALISGNNFEEFNLDKDCFTLCMELKQNSINFSALCASIF